VETRPGDQGVVVIYHITERPLLTSVEFSEIKPMTRSQMEDQLRQRETELKIGVPVDYGIIKKAEELLRNMLAEKGHMDALVTSELEEITPGTVAVTFDIEPGGKTRVRSIEFTGNDVFSGRKLRRALTNTREHHWWKLFKRGTSYHPLAFDQDLEAVRRLYLDRGYIDVKIKPPIVEVVEDKPHKKPHKSKKWLAITVPIEEGISYKVGEMTVEGNTVFTEEQILARIPLRTGMTYSGTMMQAGTSTIELEYGERGYFYVSSSPRLKRNDDETVDVRLRIDEDQRYFINRIEFVGNSTTRDKVLRRELGVNEQDVFNLKRFNIGMRRINQLGYWQLTREPLIRPIEGESKVDITVHGREESRNEIQIGGGYSGVDGGFFTASYATRNFLGLGEIVTTSAQLGGRSDRFNIAFEEPYFLGKPITFGFSLFRRDTEFTDFSRRGSGLSLTLGRRIANFQAVRATYRLEELKIEEDEQFGGSDDATVTSSLIPSYVLNTVNNPFRPSRGHSLRMFVEYAGGILGGDNFFVKPLLRSSNYFPAYKRTFFAIHSELGWVERFGDGLMPISERFFLGGEIRGPRVFETRSISPIGFRAVDNTNDCISEPPDPNDPDDDRFFNQFTVLGIDANGNPTTTTQKQPFLDECGGNKYYLAQMEYVVPVGQPMQLALFFDAGNTFLDDVSFNVDDVKMSAGLEARFFLPVFQFPLRLIYGFVIDPEEDEDSNTFQFSIGRSF
jgi:outer membrane protein insertion porin family